MENLTCDDIRALRIEAVRERTPDDKRETAIGIKMPDKERIEVRLEAGQNRAVVILPSGVNCLVPVETNEAP